MSNQGPGDRKKTPEERLAELRANAKQITQQAQNRPAQAQNKVAQAQTKTAAPKPALRPPVPGHVVDNHIQLASAKAAERQAMGLQSQAQKNVAHASSNVKREFAKAAARRPAQDFNRAATIQKTRSR
jgi:uncharacterized protein involved in copper resistance